MLYIASTYQTFSSKGGQVEIIQIRHMTLVVLAKLRIWVKVATLGNFPEWLRRHESWLWMANWQFVCSWLLIGQWKTTSWGRIRSSCEVWCISQNYSKSSKRSKESKCMLFDNKNVWFKDRITRSQTKRCGKWEQSVKPAHFNRRRTYRSLGRASCIPRSTLIWKSGVILQDTQ